MKVVQFKEQAEELNISIEEIRDRFEKELSEGKIFGIFAPEKAEIICFEPDEMQTLVKELLSGRISLNNIAEELKVSIDQVRLVLEYLLDTKRIFGTLTYSGYFIADRSLKKARLKVLQVRKRNHRLKTMLNKK